MGIHPVKAVNMKSMNIYYRTMKGRKEEKEKSASLSFQILRFIKQYFFVFLVTRQVYHSCSFLTTISRYYFTKFNVYYNNLITLGVIVEIEGSIGQRYKGHFFMMKKSIKGNSDLNNPYVHSMFPLLLIKQIFQKKPDHRGQHPKARQFWPRINPALS